MGDRMTIPKHVVEIHHKVYKKMTKFEYKTMLGKSLASKGDPFGLVDEAGYLVDHISNEGMRVEWIAESELDIQLASEEDKEKFVTHLSNKSVNIVL